MKRKAVFISVLSAVLFLTNTSFAQEEKSGTKISEEDNGIWTETELPVCIQYYCLDETLVTDETEDPELIGRIIDALKDLKVGEKTEPMEILDSGDDLTFLFEDGRKVHLEFNDVYWITEDGEWYEVEGMEKLHFELEYILNPDKARWREDENMILKIGDKEVPVTWEDNESVEAIRALLPLEIRMSQYGGFEQVGPIGQSIPQDDKKITAMHGDIVLYSGDQISIIYESNTWSYTRLGHVNLSQREMRDLLGKGDVVITFEEAAEE